MTEPLQAAHLQHSAGEPTWGAPQSTPSNWSTKKTLATVGIAAVIAAAGGGVIYAASGSSHGNHGGPGMGMGTPGMNGPGGQGGNSFGPGGNGVSGTGTGAALHGQFVVSDGNGGYATELTQTGTVTAVSADSITAKSADNYTHTYTIGSDTRESSGVQVGDTVSIRAMDANGASTATAVLESSASQSPDGMSRRGGRMGNGPGSMNGTDTPPAAAN